METLCRIKTNNIPKTNLLKGGLDFSTEQGVWSFLDIFECNWYYMANIKVSRVSIVKGSSLLIIINSC